MLYYLIEAIIFALFILITNMIQVRGGQKKEGILLKTILIAAGMVVMSFILTLPAYFAGSLVNLSNVLLSVVSGFLVIVEAIIPFLGVFFLARIMGNLKISRIIIIICAFFVFLPMALNYIQMILVLLEIRKLYDMTNVSFMYSFLAADRIRKLGRLTVFLTFVPSIILAISCLYNEIKQCGKSC